MNSIPRKGSVLVIVFFIVIWLPATAMILKLDQSKRLSEKRELAKLPTLKFTLESLYNFPQNYRTYFNDHFGFRELLVRTNFIIRYDLLGASPSNKVIVGKNGWLFNSSDGELEDYRGITKFDDTTLKNWAITLEKKRIWLEKQGIRYLFIVAPNKSSIYGEFLPDLYNHVRERTALDELVEYLKKYTSVEFVDLRPALSAAKSKERLYYKTDTHWNYYGAFLAYQQIMQPVAGWFPSLKIQTIDRYVVEKKMGEGGDLAGMIGGTGFITEEEINLKPIDGHSMTIEGINERWKSPVTVTRNDSFLPHALVFRDSFFSQVAPFLAEHFKCSSYFWQYWHSLTPIEEMLKRTHPDIVIEEIIERHVKDGMADFVTHPPINISD